ncbi:MAG: protein-disulfide reductase DsbD family protein [Devosia sp.]|nr:protein-disulfide reductase DsbD family protein [Devosia sp.]
MRHLMTLVLLLLPVPALAAATPWQDVAPGARLRLISSDVRHADGTTLVGIELDMPDSYKTYWRHPGESGIPTQLDLTGSAGVGDPIIDWPFPTPETSNGYLDYVYHGPTVLPVRVRATGEAALLKASLVMGVCSDVCVPVRASFSLPLGFAAADPVQSIRLRQAEALSPIAWDKAAPPFAEITYDAVAKALRIGLADGSIDPASILVTTSDPSLIFDAPQKSPDKRSILLSLRGEDRGPDWTKRPIQLTFMTSEGSFEASEQVTASRP